jgi:hypothetical protein
MKYNCPVCQSEMTVGHNEKGPVDGVFIWCRNDKCTAQEVMGHGEKEKDAWEVVQQRFVRREDRK